MDWKYIALIIHFSILWSLPVTAKESHRLETKDIEVYFIHDEVKHQVTIPHIWTNDPRFQDLVQGRYEIVISNDIFADKMLDIRLNSKFTQNVIPFVVFHDGQEIHRYGDPSDPDNLYQLILPFQGIQLEVDTLPLRLEVLVFKNSSTLWPGLHHLEILTAKDAHRKDFYLTLLSAAMLGAIFMVGLYHLMLWYLNRSETSNLAFIIFCFTVFIFTALHVSTFLYKLFPMSAQVFWATQAFAWFGAMAAYDAFSYMIYPDRFPRKKVYLSFVLAITCWIGIWFNLYASLVFQVYSWAYLVHLAIFTYKLPQKNQSKQFLYVMLNLLLLTGAGFDLAIGIDFIDFFNILPFTFFIMIFIESYILSVQHQETKLRLLEQELHRAEVEDSLQAVQAIRERLDHSFNQIPGIKVQSTYHPAEKFGGDWMSITYSPEQRHAILLIGDVTGHGIGSGLMSVTIGATIYGALSVIRQQNQTLSVEEKLDFLAHAIHHASSDISQRLNKGMTLALIGIDMIHNFIVVKNHGHPFPYLIRQNKVKALASRGNLLGIGENPKSKTIKLPFQKGDRLFVYTDGLTENLNPNGSNLSLKDLETLLKKAGDDPNPLIRFSEYIYSNKNQIGDADDTAYMLLEFEGDLHESLEAS